ncbi:AraC family transcriptional regulator [Microbulbifer hainanensis]|uniref:AraC family transcriptional regulator n=1 Tax=Microbulbifer hainanensis TaxID=2735675 RepID=UPI001869171B|nr:AraC family transcriptional regulator [Microbulbifer hainanensis]
MTAFIRSTSLIGFFELVTELNGDPIALLRQNFLDPHKAANFEGVIPFRYQVALFEQSARQLECPDFGLRLSEFQSLMVLGPFAVVALNERDVGSALRKIIQYMGFHSTGLTINLVADETPGMARLEFDTSEPIADVRQQMELTLAVAKNAAGMLYGDDFRFHAVLLRGDSPLPATRYETCFQAPVRFRQGKYALVFDREKLHRPIDHAANFMQNTMERFIGNVTSECDMALGSQIELLIHCLLPTMRCSLVTVADLLGISLRTLQRRLAAESLVFEDMLERIRRIAADTYLSEQEMPIAQVAGLCGYTSQSSFTRACQRWHGISPRNRRKQLAAQFHAAYLSPV